MARPQGYIALLAIFYLGVFLAITTALLSYVTSFTRAERVFIAEAQAEALAEAAFDKAVYELNTNPGYTGESNTALSPGTFSVIITQVDANTKRITATGFVPSAVSPSGRRVITAEVGTDTSIVSFIYGLQTGRGGLTMTNSSQVDGNVYANGTVLLTNSSHINGDAVSAGPTGLIDGANNSITGSAYAHTLRDLIVAADAYYDTQSNVRASGSPCPNSHCHPGSSDQATTSMPISDEQIEEWETQAAGGGTATCSGSTYTINSSTTIGPKKIPCDLSITGGTVTLLGPVWVAGDVTVSGTAVVRVGTSFGSGSVSLIAEDPANPTSKGRITVANSARFEGSGTPGSYIVLVSQNRSAESGGSTAAITMSNSAEAAILYASHGKIELSNSIHLKEVTAYLLSLSNSARVTYESGLNNLVFESGPGASWVFVPGTFSMQ